MTRQALYRQAEICAGRCGRGDGRARWGARTMCRICTLRLRADRQRRYRAACDRQRQDLAA